MEAVSDEAEDGDDGGDGGGAAAVVVVAVVVEVSGDAVASSLSCGPWVAHCY